MMDSSLFTIFETSSISSSTRPGRGTRFIRFLQQLATNLLIFAIFLGIFASILLFGLTYYLSTTNYKVNGFRCPFYDGSTPIHHIKASWWCFEQRSCARTSLSAVRSARDLVKYIACKPNEALIHSTLLLLLVSLAIHLLTLPIVLANICRKNKEPKIVEMTYLRSPSIRSPHYDFLV